MPLFSCALDEGVFVRSVLTLRAELDVADRDDADYFEEHLPRYRFLLQRLAAVFPTNARDKIHILDIGSYHLHLLVLMRDLGFRVSGVDLPIYVNKSVVCERVRRHSIENKAYVQRWNGTYVGVPYQDNSFDAVIFTEALEHLTFNPTGFWKEIYRMMKNGAILIISTPNALRFFNILSHLKNILLLKSIGIPVQAIMRGGTFGHHWKEYSLSEIKDYFAMLSPDFSFLSYEFYSYRDYSKNERRLYRMIYWIQERLLPSNFKSDLFVMTQLYKQAGFLANDPDER